MKIYRFSYDTIKMDEEAISACIGYFDGLHVGHQCLLQQAIDIAKEKEICSAVITFDPDPWVVFKGLEQVPHITTLQQRQELAASYGIDVWITLDFSKEFSLLSPDEFVKKVLLPLHVKNLTCGFDYSYGKFGKGKTVDLLQYEEFETHVIDQISVQGGKISSTRIESCIEQGDMENTRKLLGRPYTMRAEVIHGKSIGHTIGYPTANIDVNGVYVIPSKGVYAAYAYVDGTCYQAMVNVGHNPTMNQRDTISIEAFLFDFNQDIYGKILTLQFYHKTRDEFKFSSKQSLVQQLQMDVQVIQTYFAQLETECLS